MSRISIAALALIFAVWGCQSTPTGNTSATEPLEVVADTPQGMLEQAARASGARRSQLYLQAAEAFLAAGDLDTAELALGEIDVEHLGTPETARFLLARGIVALSRQDLDAARADLLALDPAELPDPTRAALAQAALLNAEGQAEQAAEYLMAFQARGHQTGPDQRLLSDVIWSYVGQVPLADSRSRAEDASGAAQGWWQLRAYMLGSFTLKEQLDALADWRVNWPEHPAAAAPPSAVAALVNDRPQVRRVGLLLPLSGALSRAGRAVRDAFIATYLTRREQVAYDVLVYDTASQPIAALYEQALVDGAQVLIGPLDKEAVVEMNRLQPEVPVLALNYLGDEPPAANVLQIGLAIEDEAATLRQWLSDVHAERLLLVHNKEDWATRATRALSDSWQDSLTVQPLEDIRTVTESVGVAMHVAASEERHAELEKLLGAPLTFVPRARGDVDAIVAMVTPLEASALIPALKFHSADRVPVYTTSQTIRGVPADRLSELAGFHVTELPWLSMNDGSYRSLEQAFSLDGSPFVSLYALGVDAFRLADRAPLIVDGRFTALLGSTGELTFSANGRIQRRLARTVVEGARLVPNRGSAVGR